MQLIIISTTELKNLTAGNISDKQESSESDTSTEIDANVLNTDQIVDFLHDFSAINYGGKWSSDSLSNIQKINSNFVNPNGKAKYVFYLSSFADSVNPIYYLEMTLTLYDGEFLNDNIEISTSFDIKEGVVDGLNEK